MMQKESNAESSHYNIQQSPVINNRCYMNLMAAQDTFDCTYPTFNKISTIFNQTLGCDHLLVLSLQDDSNE